MCVIGKTKDFCQAWRHISNANTAWVQTSDPCYPNANERTGQTAALLALSSPYISGYIDMQIIRNPEELQKICLSWRFADLKTALVPTMGYLHAGHASLIRKAREMGDRVVVSAFVNPSQFGPNEDLASYPRDFERDRAMVESLGADVLFAPEASAMYSPDHRTWVDVPEMANILCGRSRPGHFRGVCTVVNKLFMLSLPTFAMFGQKDWQQLAVLRRMVRDLNIPVTLVGCPIVREENGLALSSRNAYLTPDERSMAHQLQAGLRLAKTMTDNGEKDPATLEGAVRAFWKTNLPLGEVEYLSFVDPDSLATLERITGSALAAAAVRLGKARLIDNLLLR